MPESVGGGFWQQFLIETKFVKIRWSSMKVPTFTIDAFYISFFSKWRSNNPSLHSFCSWRQAHLQEVRLLQRGLQARGNGEMRWGTWTGGGVAWFWNGRWSWVRCVFCLYLENCVAVNFHQLYPQHHPQLPKKMLHYVFQVRDGKVFRFSCFFFQRKLPRKGWPFLLGTFTWIRDPFWPGIRSTRRVAGMGKWWKAQAQFQLLGVINQLLVVLSLADKLSRGACMVHVKWLRVPFRVRLWTSLQGLMWGKTMQTRTYIGKSFRPFVNHAAWILATEKHSSKFQEHDDSLFLPFQRTQSGSRQWHTWHLDISRVFDALAGGGFGGQVGPRRGAARRALAGKIQGSGAFFGVRF